VPAATGGEQATRGSVELRVGAFRVKIVSEFPCGPVCSRAITPFARELVGQILSEAVREAERAGRSVSCKAGCGACCRQAVPIGADEAQQLRELVDSMPEERRSRVKARFAQAMEAVRSAGLLDEGMALGAAQAPIQLAHDEPRRLEWGLKYFDLGIACPFLEDESCSIHPQRPLICREFLVTSPAERCRTPAVEGIQTIALPGSVSRAFRDLRPFASGARWIPLIAALEVMQTEPAQTEAKLAGQWIGQMRDSLAEARSAGASGSPAMHAAATPRP
jgi:Fe-S-cluster containining protein